MAPIVVGNHVIVGTGNDLDMPGFLQSFDPETGKLQWKFYTVPMKPGDPGLDTWPSLSAAQHGGGQAWIPGVYDPETNLYIFGTGNPTPGYTGVGRKGDNLFTCSLIAVNVETGKMAWYFQTSPHDTHDWDSAQTPILIDATINGRPRKLVSTAARNGYFFTRRSRHRRAHRHGQVRRRRRTGRRAFARTARRIRIPEKEATIPGSLVSPVEGGVTNWQPSAYSPDTGLFYAQENNGFNIVYLTDPDPRGSMGLGGKLTSPVGSGGNALSAIDPKTGKNVWRHPWPGERRRRSGTAGDGGQGAVHRRRQRQLRRVRRGQRQDPLAHAHRQHLQRAADLHDRRQAARARRRRRHALCVHAESVMTAGSQVPGSRVSSEIRRSGRLANWELAEPIQIRPESASPHRGRASRPRRGCRPPAET